MDNMVLTSSHTFLDSLIENIPIMVFVKDAKELRFVRFNKVAEDLLGFSRKSMIGKNDYDLFPKEQADAFTANDRAVLAGRAAVDIPEEPIQTKSGIKILHTKKIPLRGESGKVEYLLGISEDITEKKKIEEERIRWVRDEATLKEREIAGRKRMFLAEASAILSSSLDYKEILRKIPKLAIPFFADWSTLTVLEEDGSYRQISVIQVDPKKPPLMLEMAPYCPTHLSHTKGAPYVIHNGKSIMMENASDSELLTTVADMNHQKAMQEMKSNSCMIVPIPMRDKKYASISFVSGKSGYRYDLEDLALAEELGRRAGIAIDNALLYATAQKAIETRDEFMSIASHELKTPITSLKLQIELTKNRIHSHDHPLTVIDSKLIKSIENSSIQVERLTHLIESLLDISRIKLGKLEFVFQRLNVSDVIYEAVERLTDQLEAANCSVIRLNIPEDLYANWDRNRIEQVLVNLLSNAIKYAKGSPIHIFSSCDNGIASITVQDFGPGISKEQQNKIFNRFERADAPRNISGLGLGLFIARQIIEGHQGSIRVESNEGSGSKFIIELPLFPINLGLEDRVSNPSIKPSTNFTTMV